KGASDRMCYCPCPESARKRDYDFALTLGSFAESKNVRQRLVPTARALGVRNSFSPFLSSLFDASLVEVSGIGRRQRRPIRDCAATTNAAESKSGASGWLLRRRALEFHRRS